MAVTSERVVRVITKQVRVSSRMSQSALALDHLRTLSCVAACTHATFAQQHLCAALLRAGEVVCHLHSVTSHVDCFVDTL